MNLFDVEHENGPLMREKSRAATETEAKAYVTWLRERRGLRLFDNVELHHKGTGSGRAQSFIYWAATFGKCLKSGGRQNGEVIAPEYQEGAYSILIPGHDQIAPRVTMETLDEAGEVLTSQTLPVEPKKGGVIWDREAVRKACGPIAKPAKAKRSKVVKQEAAPMPEISSPAPAQEESAPIAAQESGETVNALTGAEIALDELLTVTQELPAPADEPAPAIVNETLTVPAPDLEAITARLDALEAALATLSAMPAHTPTVETVERPKRTAAHERAIRRAWQERKARRAARFNHELKRDQLDNANRSVTYWRELAEAETLRANDTARELNAANESLALGRAEMAVIAPMLAKYADKRRKADQRARRMIAAVRARADLDKRALAITNATLSRLKRDMADPMQPERASDIARLVGERDTARTALAAMAARAERAEQTVNAMADRFEGLVSRVTRAEAALRQANAA